MNNKAITHVKIPNKFGVEKQILIEFLSEKQFEIQLYHCNKEAEKISEQIKNLKQSNIQLNKIHTEDAKRHQAENVKQMIRFENIYDFVTKLEFTLTNAFINKFKKDEIDSFENVSQEQY